MSHYQTIAKALAYIKGHALEQPELEAVAAHVNMSTFHFQRVFTEWAGVSPKKFLQFLTLQHAKTILAETSNLADAAYTSGLSSSSRLHDLFLRIEGITPGEFKKQGYMLRLAYSFGNCIFGNYLVASTDKGICHLHFYEDGVIALDELRATWPHAVLEEQVASMHLQVADLLQNKMNSEQSKLSLHLKGTPFQLKVWEALLRIPEGKFTSYATLAQHIGQPTASRAVGTAIGSNPIAYLIPCHRVIKSMGGIGEYRWGSERKMAMLGREAAQCKISSE